MKKAEKLMKSSAHPNSKPPSALGRLAKALASASDRTEAAQIEEQLTRGFYGDSDTNRRRRTRKEEHIESRSNRAARVR